MTGFVQHGPGEFCAVMTREGEPLVEYEWWDPAPESGPPTIGRCRNCGHRGVVYEPLPADPARDELAERFAGWMGGMLDWDVKVREEHADLHKELFDLHAPVGVVVLDGKPGAAPVKVRQCRECGGDGWPCRTLRILAKPHRWAPGWDERWSA
ncbi:hypothetical protein [Nonomuraea sp. NPDC005650]|uniref:hypothetical protein n=1 Tax=Nonomuraea sp. NPDC005650 TaxID=3157045 RepID=UPI00339F4126